MPLSQANVREVLPDISEEMEQLIKSLTAFDYKDRMSSSAALVDHLNKSDVAEAGGVGR
jgi:hypothetical protein